jgi:hypothetical protein
MSPPLPDRVAAARARLGARARRIACLRRGIAAAALATFALAWGVVAATGSMGASSTTPAADPVGGADAAAATSDPYGDGTSAGGAAPAYGDDDDAAGGRELEGEDGGQGEWDDAGGAAGRGPGAAPSNAAPSTPAPSSPSGGGGLTTRQS